MNHAAASTVKVVTEGLLLDHGETETRPMPAPSATNAKENAAATNAPAKTAAHDTPETVSIAFDSRHCRQGRTGCDSRVCHFSISASQDEIARPALAGRDDGEF